MYISQTVGAKTAEWCENRIMVQNDSSVYNVFDLCLCK